LFIFTSINLGPFFSVSFAWAISGYILFSKRQVFLKKTQSFFFKKIYLFLKQANTQFVYKA